MTQAQAHLNYVRERQDYEVNKPVQQMKEALNKLSIDTVDLYIHDFDRDCQWQ